MPALAFALGLAAGIVVTRKLHNDPEAGKWGERIGRTRLRYANVPVGGTLAFAAAALAPEQARATLRGAGAGMLIGAVGWGAVDPLPPAT